MISSEWNNLVKAHLPPFGAFLQSFEWGEFQAALGFKVERISEDVKGKSVIAQAVNFPMPLKSSYWHLPKGPLGDASVEKAIELLCKKLPGGAFLKIEPVKLPKKGQKSLDRQPSVTTIVDLSQTEEQILSAFKQKTRYNVRLAEKKGVTAQIVGLEQFEDLVRLMQQTAERDKFSLHELDHYKTMLQKLQSDDCRAFLAMAYYEGRPLAANVMIDAFGTRTYLHGASSNLYRNVMAPYALHKFLILDAKQKGLSSYDFWGIAPPESGEDHPWAGITRFKLGFGGKVVTMPGTYDVRKQTLMYFAYRLAKSLRR